ncbi:MAG: hypothetical protein IJ545_06960 [Alphaproteobacteria bacterium]|nr:hypothetical protein [Alphaproteobacteria bacterium]
MKVELKDLKYYMDSVAKEQLPFAASKALTNTSSKIGEDLAKQAAHQFRTLTPFSRTHRTARLGGQPSPGSSFATIPAAKSDGLDRMQAILGNQHWGIAQQIDDTSTVRRPNKSKYLWVPVQGRKRNFGPGKAMTQKGVFITKTKDGKTLIMQRKGKSRTVTALFSRRKKQTINPRFDMKLISQRRAQRYMGVFFDRAMTAALRTAR